MVNGNQALDEVWVHVKRTRLFCVTQYMDGKAVDAFGASQDNSSLITSLLPGAWGSDVC